MRDSPLTAETAGRFCAGQEIDLARFSSLDDVAARVLARHEGPLRLDGIATLSEIAAEALGRHQQGLFLLGLEELSEAGTEHLSRHPQVVLPPTFAAKAAMMRQKREELAEQRRLERERKASARAAAGPPVRRIIDPAALVIPEDGEIHFFRRDRRMFRFLSNFFEAPIELDGEVWRSTEYYYQAQKSYDPTYREVIRRAPSPGDVKRLAGYPAADRPAKLRKASWFYERTELIRPDWSEAKLAIMEKAIDAKFGQNPDLRAALLATGDAPIVEDSPSDDYWGIGSDGRGANQLGRLLMRLRAQIAATLPQSD